MLQRADSALYEAKRAGRNCVKAQMPAPETVDLPAPVSGRRESNTLELPETQEDMMTKLRRAHCGRVRIDD